MDVPPRRLAPADTAPAGVPAPVAASTARWVPVRRLAPRHRSRLLQHLRALPEHDRYLRFGYAATDEQIGRYVETLDFSRDMVLGIFNRRLALIAVAHLAIEPPAPQRTGRPAMAEFGVSVLAAYRGRRLGGRLFEQAVLHARNRGLETLFIHALSENIAMLKIARRAGATVERDGPESQAWLKLPPHTIASQVDQLLGDQAAELDYQWKLNRHRFGRWIDFIAEVRRHYDDRSGRIGSQ